MKNPHPNNVLTTVLTKRRLWIEICNGEDSHQATWGRAAPYGSDLSPLFHPNPGKMASGLPAAPMWNAKDGMPVPEMQDNSKMLKKSNMSQLPYCSFIRL
jgi:hypothetical protein